MFALITGYRRDPVTGIDREWAEARIVSTHRTLKAAQRAFRKFQRKPGWDKGDNSPYDMLGILTQDGLVNYHGERVRPDYMGRSIQCRMGLYGYD